LEVSTPVEAVPLIASEPLQPPEAVHVLALVEVHVSVDVVPEPIVEGDAPSDTVGAAGNGVDPVAAV
jgi:hypothetical protein